MVTITLVVTVTFMVMPCRVLVVVTNMTTECVFLLTRNGDNLSKEVPLTAHI
jgi:hypothetical protein